MTGLILAAGSFAALIVISIVLLRFYKGRKYFFVLIPSYVISAFLYLQLFNLFPSDLGFLPQDWIEPLVIPDMVNGLLVLTLLFLTYWDTLYTTTFTGFSANLMVTLSRRGAMSREDFLRMHGAERELDIVSEWRIRNLVEGGYIARNGGDFQLRPKGRLLGMIVAIITRIMTGRAKGG